MIQQITLDNVIIISNNLSEIITIFLIQQPERYLLFFFLHHMTLTFCKSYQPEMLKHLKCSLTSEITDENPFCTWSAIYCYCSKYCWKITMDNSILICIQYTPSHFLHPDQSKHRHRFRYLKKNHLKNYLS